MELIDTEESKSLASKYRIKKVLGGGGNSSTFIAEVIADPGKVNYNIIYVTLLGICIEDDKFG